MKITLNGISKSYGTRRILDGIDQEFLGGGLYVLMGDNGCGKSTLLRICALLEPPDSGEIKFDGSGSVNGLRRQVTLVLPSGGLFDDTVFNNAAYGLRVRKVSKAETQSRVEAVLDLVGLKGSQHARSLSSGEAQRLALARAIVIRPKVLLLDEPTASVDRQNTRLIESVITGLNEQSECTIVMTTHDELQARRLEQSAAMLEFAGGRLRAV